MKIMIKHLGLLVILLSSVLSGCSKSDGILYSVDDLDGTHIAVLDGSVSDKEFEEVFPTSDMVHFKYTSEFLLALAIGKCDAGFVEREEGEYLRNRNSDYHQLSYSGADKAEAMLIVHRRLLPGRNQSAHDGDILEKSVYRINRSIISEGYWLLILKGFAVTLLIFMMGIVMSFLLACLMLGMNRHPYLRYFSRPVSWFIKTIHDVPSVVLIFFFYYVVFATSHISGIIVCAISLGVYSSGSLMNIFTVHLNQVDRNQHAAAEMLGLTGWKKYRYVILPQAVKPMLPLIGAECKVLLRATTFAGYISELDLVKVTEIIRNQTYDVLVPLLLVSVIFLILSHFIVEGLSAIYNKAFKYDQN